MTSNSRRVVLVFGHRADEALKLLLELGCSLAQGHLDDASVSGRLAGASGNLSRQARCLKQTRVILG